MVAVIWGLGRVDGGWIGGVCRGVVWDGGFCAWHLLAFLCLAPFCLFVPGTFCRFCTWHLLPFLYLAPFAVFVPGTFCRFCTWHLLPFLYLAPFD
ncbi:hypothetical protein ABER02_14780, partial [Rossellomorea marisflavi]|uniref:hypothetical protein n=1 Tax=Rossellomorea marisflavi TaxID=189381 RepID=UPI003D280D5D